MTSLVDKLLETDEKAARIVEMGLTTSDVFVRLEWARSKTFKPNSHQVMRGLQDKERAIRLAWVERNDYVMSEKQVNLVLCFIDAGYKDCLCALAQKPDLLLNQAQLETLQLRLSRLDQDEYPELLEISRRLTALSVLSDIASTRELSMSPRL